jgi:hypothetical protein
MKTCKKNCACKIEGKTHFLNDGCNCLKHNGEQKDFKFSSFSKNPKYNAPNLSGLSAKTIKKNRVL